MKTSSLIGLTVLSLCTYAAPQACGPDFPLMLTTCRGSCLLQIKDPGFAYNLGRLTSAVAATTGGVVLVGTGMTTVAFESTDPDPATRARLADMRRAVSGDAAYNEGAGLDEARRLYTAGAVEFNRVHQSIDWDQPRVTPSLYPDEVDSGLSAAIKWFERVVALPTDSARPRLVWATFMLGRAHLLRNRPGDVEAAQKQYLQTLDLVSQGLPDPLGLGNFTLGQLASIAMTQHDYAAAAAFYVRQAGSISADGSQPTDERAAGRAIESLERLARRIPDNEAVLQTALKDPLLQRLLIALAIEHSDETCRYADCSGGGQVGPPSATIVKVLGTFDPRDVEWPDQVAAIAFAVGNFEVASKLSQVSDSPYSEWLRAKLALHDGDTDRALQSFARASKRFAVADDPDVAALSQVTRDRFHAEHGLLLLSRSDYLEALFQLAQSDDYGDDARYVAERVLTVDELRSLVDQQPSAAKYRDLLARRLARSGRPGEAQSYYGDYETKLVSEQYTLFRQQAENPGTKASQAQGYYLAAKLELRFGMELLGTERCPDFSEYGGAFGWDCGGMPETNGDLTTADEKTRVAASAAEPNVRFHYRNLAVRHLLLAADRLPRRSLVMTSVLCNGVGWLQHHGRDEELIRTLYRRYLRDGRPTQWTADFGTQCPEPDFKLSSSRAPH